MKVTGDAVLHAPVAQVWDALLDPAVLVRTIPGCEQLETTGEHSYAMTVSMGVAAVRGTYSGSCELRDLHPHESLVLKATGAGAPGTIDANVAVRFTDNGDETTRLDYDADSVVGGTLGGVGQRMLASVSRRTADEFFRNVDQALSGPEPAAATAPSEEPREQMPAVYTDARPGRAPGRVPGGGDFLSGIAVGAALVALGVVLGRRR